MTDDSKQQSSICALTKTKENPLNDRIAIDNSLRKKLEISLLLLRIGVAIVFLMWTVDKFVNPEHAAKVFEKFYKINGLNETMAYLTGGVQLVIVLAFLVGAFRTVTYSIIALMHAVSTFSSFNQYLDPWTYPHLLFFAAISMLSACIALWLLRKHDNLLSVDGIRNASRARSI